MATNTREITVQGETFTVQQPYAEGHTITAAEANALNQVRAENIRNNQAKAVKEAKGDEDKMEEVRKAFAEYDKAYDFTQSGGGRALDPLDRIARGLAKDAITEQLKAKGVKIKDVDKDALNELVAKTAREDKEIIAAAKRILKARENAPDAGSVDVASLLNAEAA